MAKVLDPLKELRFTRNAQAIIFASLSCISLAAGVTLLLITYSVSQSPFGLDQLPFPIWFNYLSWLPMIGFLWLAYHCIKHPYLILSPIGVEIFPFFKPAKNFQLVEWGRIALAESEGSKLTMHYNQEKTGGVVLTLTPLTKNSRMLLMSAFEGVMDQQKNKS